MTLQFTIFGPWSKGIDKSKSPFYEFLLQTSNNKSWHNSQRGFGLRFTLQNETQDSLIDQSTGYEWY